VELRAERTVQVLPSITLAQLLQTTDERRVPFSPSTFLRTTLQRILPIENTGLPVCSLVHPPESSSHCAPTNNPSAGTWKRESQHPSICPPCIHPYQT